MALLSWPARASPPRRSTRATPSSPPRSSPPPRSQPHASSSRSTPSALSAPPSRSTPPQAPGHRSSVSSRSSGASGSPPFIVTVFRALLSSPHTFSTTFSCGSVVQHLPPRARLFALLELLLTNAPPAPLLVLPVQILLLTGYLGVAYITKASQRFYRECRSSRRFPGLESLLLRSASRASPLCPRSRAAFSRSMCCVRAVSLPVPRFFFASASMPCVPALALRVCLPSALAPPFPHPARYHTDHRACTARSQHAPAWSRRSSSCTTHPPPAGDTPPPARGWARRLCHHTHDFGIATNRISSLIDAGQSLRSTSA
ncbi:hypothetical protein FB451DRAFT_1304760 [Mycena latifolia]|nr:hypothetical protein FB451DRAFT_1304760 [Mycena latifolia]